MPAQASSRLPRDREKVILERIADIMRNAEPTAFAAEGPCRHGIRSSLCLQGWRWALADIIAAQIVAGALGMVRARRPTWPEGQPEWTQPGALPIERERCMRCHKRLPEGHWKFCGHVCASAYTCDRWYREHRDAVNAERRARYHALLATKGSRR